MKAVVLGEDIVIGVDEAGRGSLVGEMVIVAYAVSLDNLADVEAIGVKDSKELSPEARARLYVKLARLGFFTATFITPREIDTYNLNKLEARKVVELLRRISRVLSPRASVKRVSIDKFGEAETVARGVLSALSHVNVVEVVVEEKADSRYPETAAASIIAKHLRDTRLRVLSRLYGVKGSGYPSDPRTVEWVKEVLEKGERPPIIRYSWYTIKKLGGPWIKKKGGAPVRTLDEFLK